jgi:hypothetical protein
VVSSSSEGSMSEYKRWKYSALSFGTFSKREFKNC